MSPAGLGKEGQRGPYSIACQGKRQLFSTHAQAGEGSWVAVFQCVRPPPRQASQADPAHLLDIGQPLEYFEDAILFEGGHTFLSRLQADQVGIDLPLDQAFEAV